MPKKRAKKNAPKKIVIRVRVIPLAELKKRLAAAQTATSKFVTDRRGLKWSTEDETERQRLISDELNASIRVTDHAIHRGKAKR